MRVEEGESRVKRTPSILRQHCWGSCRCCPRHWGLEAISICLTTSGGRILITITAIELVVEDFTRVLLGLLGSVRVVKVSLVAAGDLSLRHIVGV